MTSQDPLKKSEGNGKRRIAPEIVLLFALPGFAIIASLGLVFISYTHGFGTVPNAADGSAPHAVAPHGS